jgi:Ca2+-dependent lipid-binding protein
MTRYQLSMHAEHLPRNWFHTPSPYAVATITDGPLKGTKIGQTETLPKTTDPDWVAVLFFETDSSIYMPLKIQVFDEREYNDDILLGEATFEATEIFGAAGHLKSAQLNYKGPAQLYVSVQTSIQGNDRGIMELQFRGLDIKNIEPGLLGLGRSDPFLELAKKNADHTAGVVRWNVVHRSAHIQDHLNPFWESFTVGLEELCYNDLNWPMRILVKDWQANGRHRIIGQFETTMSNLMERVAVRGNADRQAAFEIFLDSLGGSLGKSKGFVCVLKATLYPEK